MRSRRRGDRRGGATSRAGLTRFVGLTGGIGAGKSEALAAFERRGAGASRPTRSPTTSSTTTQVRDALVDRWGEGSLRTAASTATGWGDRLRRPRRARLARVRHPSTRRRARARVASRTWARMWRSPWSRSRCCSKRRWRTRFDATLAVVADDELARCPAARARAGWPGGPRGPAAGPGREGAPCRPRHPQRCLARGVG